MVGSMVKIEIDGKDLNAEQGSMIIEAADSANIHIPRFCYHKKLSIAANCRMCLVEVDNIPKAVPACATPVTDGMKINTKSSKARDAQKAVMEFLLINHPLDCPICDQGGECELQDVSMGYGKGVSRYSETKRSVNDQNLGPLISTEMTRCIHCTRCVRFGEEVAGVKELGLVGRGEHTEISTYVEQSMDFEMSGNVIDLCPVGALTSKPYRYSARAWELRQSPSVAPHDCVGSNLYVHTLRGQVKRIVPKENESINETWLSDRDRFSYEALSHNDRVINPKIKIDGVWQDISWDEALNHVINSLTKTIGKHGVTSVASLLSSSSTLEEMYLLQKIVRSLGSHNIDYRLTEQDFSDEESFGVFPGLKDFKIEDIEKFDNILIVGSNLRKENPIINHKVRKASLQKAKVSVINPVKFDFNYDLSESFTDFEGNGDIVGPLIKITKYILDKTKFDLNVLYGDLEDYNLEQIISDFNNVKLDETNPRDQQLLNIAQLLIDIDNSVVLLGSFVSSNNDASLIRSLCHILRCITGCKLGFLTKGANAAGAWISGAIPHRSDTGLDISHTGMNYKQMLDEKSNLKYFLLFNCELEYDASDYKILVSKLSESEQVVSFTPFVTDAILKYSDIILPIAPFTETSGTYVNVTGEWQSFQGSIKSQGNSRPGWKVLRVLGNLLNLLDFKYNSTAEIREQDKKIFLIHDANIYNVDSITRRASSLSQTKDATKLNFIYINSSNAKDLKLCDTDMVSIKLLSPSKEKYETNLLVKVSDCVPKNCAYTESANIGFISDYIELFKI